jgi:hypothetical protein
VKDYQASHALMNDTKKKIEEIMLDLDARRSQVPGSKKMECFSLTESGRQSISPEDDKPLNGKVEILL